MKIPYVDLDIKSHSKLDYIFCLTIFHYKLVNVFQKHIFDINFINFSRLLSLFSFSISIYLFISFFLSLSHSLSLSLTIFPFLSLCLSHKHSLSLSVSLTSFFSNVPIFIFLSHINNQRSSRRRVSNPRYWFLDTRL